MVLEIGSGGSFVGYQISSNSHKSSIIVVSLLSSVKTKVFRCEGEYWPYIMNSIFNFWGPVFRCCIFNISSTSSGRPNSPTSTYGDENNLMPSSFRVVQAEVT